MARAPLIAPEAYKAFREAVFLDARDPEAYAKQRFQGAVRVPVEVWEAAAKAPETGLENEAFWHAQIGALGVDGVRRVVVYDDGRLTEAARVWFILQHFGADVAIVNGGWPALLSLYVARVERGEASIPQPVTFKPLHREALAALVTRSQVRQAIDREAIWDARTAAEHSGQDMRNNPRGGHLPGATLVSHAHLFNEKGRLHAPEALRYILEKAGFDPHRPLVTHCDGAGALRWPP